MKTPSSTREGDQEPALSNGEIKMLWVTDPWSTLDHLNDTTLRLMHEAINMGIPTFWSASDQLFSSSITENVMAVKLQRGQPFDFSDVEMESIPLSSFQQIHYRVDPPVDDHYRGVVNELLARGTSPSCILNPPHLIKNQSEKIPPADLSVYAPKLMIATRESDYEKLERLFADDAQIVSKPLHLAQSIGVKKHSTPENSEEWKKLLRELTADFTTEILLEEYLPEIEKGEVRLWFAGSVLVAALKKYPKAGDFRVLIDEGSQVSAHVLTPEEEKIAEDIGKSLEKQGILLAAIDLIGNKICDYNITSPGLLVQLERVHGGENFAKTILTQALRYRAPGDRGSNAGDPKTSPGY